MRFAANNVRVGAKKTAASNTHRGTGVSKGPIKAVLPYNFPKTPPIAMSAPKTFNKTTSQEFRKSQRILHSLRIESVFGGRLCSVSQPGDFAECTFCPT